MKVICPIVDRYKVNRLNYALLFWSGLIKCLTTFVQMLVLSISKTVLLPLNMLRI